ERQRSARRRHSSFEERLGPRRRKATTVSHQASNDRICRALLVRVICCSYARTKRFSQRNCCTTFVDPILGIPKWSGRLVGRRTSGRPASDDTLATGNTSGGIAG